MTSSGQSERERESSVMMSSVMPSEKYCCSGSPLMLENGRTAIEGLSGRENDAPVAPGTAPFATLNTCTGLVMFLSSTSPMSSKA